MGKMHNKMTWNDMPEKFDVSICLLGTCLALIISNGYIQSFLYINPSILACY